MGNVRDLRHPEMFQKEDLWGKPVKPPEYPEWFTVGKWTPRTHVQNAGRGLHPMGNKLGPESSRCGTCSHAHSSHWRSKYKKCDLVKNTNGPGTDIRFKWRGCEFWNQNVEKEK